MKKTTQLIKKIVACICMVTVLINIGFTQDDKAAKASQKQADIKRVVEMPDFAFKAETASPTGGQLRQLTPGYDLRVSKDTITAYLPYFGRAYSAPIDPSGTGIQFTSTTFDYKSTRRKKGGWDIMIKPRNTSDARQLMLTVFDNGRASLQVVSVNRQPIMFSGYVTGRNSK